jgi:hypothetical protein
MRVEIPAERAGGLRGDVLVAPALGAGPLPPVTARLAEAAGIDIAAIAARRGLRSPGDSTWIQVGAASGLSEFVGSMPWAHLDTAATAFRTEPDDLWPIGATGSGTRTLIEFLRADADTTTDPP